jgi:TolB-like protein
MPVRSAILSMFGALLLGATPLEGQCPDGAPWSSCSVKAKAPAAVRAVPASAVRARRLLLLPFRNVTRGAAQEWLVTGAPLMLGESLGQFRELTVVPEAVLTAARRRLALRDDAALDAGQMKRLANETDGWTAVTGNVYATGKRLRISVQATDVPTSRIITQAQTEIAADDDPRRAFDSLTVRLIAPTGVQGARADLIALTTQSADAYRAYVRGVGFLASASYKKAESAFAEAVGLDSTFAMAWARLGYAAFNADVFAMVANGSTASRAIEQAARLGARLPARQRALVGALQSVIRTEWGPARILLDSLVRSDPDDLDAKELLAGHELNGLEIDDARPAHLVSSTNRGLAIASDILSRDPGRRNIYGAYTMTFATAGGWGFSERFGVRGRFPSFTAVVFKILGQGGPDAEFISLVRPDSIETIRTATFQRLPAAERARLRRIAADRGMEWADRWVTAGPQDAEAHLWKSRLAELRDDPALALRELAVAESLGVQTSWENQHERRLRALVNAGRLDDANRLTDSLVASGALARVPIFPGFDNGRGWGLVALLLKKRWSAAGALVAALPPSAWGRHGCDAAVGELSTNTGEAGGNALRSVVDTVARHLTEVAAITPLTPCLGALVTVLNDSMAGRQSVAGAALLATADSLHQRSAGGTLAYDAARWAWAVDSSRHDALRQRSWFLAQSRANAIGERFTPSAAVIEGDSATFDLSLRSPVGGTASPSDSSWTLFIDLDGANPADRYSLDLSFSTGVPTQLQRVRDWPVTAQGKQIVAQAHVTADGIRVVARGPFVDDVRRFGVTTVRFRPDRCIGAGDGLCARPSLPVIFR